MIVPLGRMPLTPNGKVDKNALPFPDTVLNATSEDRSKTPHILTILERKLIDIWSFVLFPPPEKSPENAKPKRLIGVEENFFDVGGHSILATRLIFQIRRQLKLEGDTLPLNILFRCPTVKSMANEIERVVSFGVVDTKIPSSEKSADEKPSAIQMDDGALDLSPELVLPKEFKVPANAPFAFDMPECAGAEEGTFEPRALFLTGVTGFLGAFLLYYLLKAFPGAHVYCLIRAKSEEDAWKRLQANMVGHLLWAEEETQAGPTQDQKMRTHVVCGDLAQPWLGISSVDIEGKPSGPNAKWQDAPEAFHRLAETVDAVVHNGALVHWVYPYETLKPANVNGTLDALKMCMMGDHMKPFYFVSSTSVLDSKSYTDRSTAVSESDDLEGSRKELQSGYGQSKWVAEKLLMMARRGGVDAIVGSSKIPVHLPIAIIRPGYIVGDSRTGVSNTDDFLWRLFKGCIQLGQIPTMSNVVNLCPVDFVAQSIGQIVRRGRAGVQRGVYQIWNPSRVRFLDLFRELQHFGYDTIENGSKGLVFKPYLQWRDALMHLTLEGKDNALYPLLHFVLDDLPASTKSPSLSWRNLKWVLEGSNISCPPIVTKEEDSLVSESEESEREDGPRSRRRSLANSPKSGALMHRYIQYLCSVGFLPWPAGMEGTVTQSKLQGRSGRTA